MSSKPAAAAKVTRIARRPADSSASVHAQQTAATAQQQLESSTSTAAPEQRNGPEAVSKAGPSMCSVSGILGDVLEREPVEPPPGQLIAPPSGSFPPVMHRKQSKVRACMGRLRQRL